MFGRKEEMKPQHHSYVWIPKTSNALCSGIEISGQLQDTFLFPRVNTS
jgi:hypothetical protein